MKFWTLLNVAELEQFNNGSILFTQVATCLTNAASQSNVNRTSFRVFNLKEMEITLFIIIQRNRLFAIVSHVINFSLNMKTVHFWNILFAGTERAF